MDMAEHRHVSNAPGADGLRGRLLREEPMARHVSWRAGGRAKRAYRPADLADLAAFLRSLPAAEPVCFVGLGSNLLVRDGGFAGTVILLHSTHGSLRVEGEVVFADAGVASPKVARLAATHGLEGAEFLAGIPGTVGGALAMNAGCYGSETWDCVERVRMIDRAGDLVERPREDFEIGYRHAALRHGRLGEDAWFVGGWFRFQPGSETRARARIRELLARRVASQPLNLPNAGSVFRNPPQGYAAQLIEACGLKGYAIGGASISEKHANFIVNPKGGASAADIEALIAHARETVRAKFGVDLIVEVRIIGDPGRSTNPNDGVRR
ncbi:MAG: UDP-N-acetylmuramate dehydrogenase [Betaproteobacteria bacterium]|jgi:UDP-N-acetylmuramate dehydrogenase|nr:UDP-N-acetylmuramate dehydrogenase [Betaproteobacteria bacterium]